MDFSDYMAYVESGRCESDYWKKELKNKKKKKILLNNEEEEEENESTRQKRKSIYSQSTN